MRRARSGRVDVRGVGGVAMGLFEGVGGGADLGTPLQSGVACAARQEGGASKRPDDRHRRVRWGGSCRVEIPGSPNPSATQQKAWVSSKREGLDPEPSNTVRIWPSITSRFH